MSLSLDIKRIATEGFRSFSRNSLVSFATVVVMTMSLLVFSGVIFLNAILGYSLNELNERVDVNIYFLPDAPEDEALALSQRISEIQGVREVSFISREEALANFQMKHADDDLIIRSLEELGDNPLGASLNVQAYDSADYEQIITAIEGDAAVANGDFIDAINYHDNRALIERLGHFSSVTRSVGYAISVFFAAIAVLVIISTLRIAIYASKNDIVVKRLVGAEHRYVRGPFLVQGILYGAVAAILAMLALIPIAAQVGAYTETFFGGMNLATYLQANFIQIFIVLLSVGVLLGIIASSISVKKYLKV
jgi:cell division transport system permease protein